MTGSTERPSRGHKKRERTRQALIAAGMQTLADKGEALTVGDVVAQAEVSQGTFYNYFRDREDFLDALAEHSLLAFAADSARASADRDPAWRFAFATLGALERTRSDPAWGRAMLRLARQQRAPSREMFRYLRDDLADGHAEGRFAFGPDDLTLDAVVGLILTSMQRLVRSGARPDHPRRVVERLLTMLGVRKDSAARIATEAADAVAADAQG